MQPAPEWMWCRVWDYFFFNLRPLVKTLKQWIDAHWKRFSSCLRSQEQSYRMSFQECAFKVKNLQSFSMSQKVLKMPHIQHFLFLLQNIKNELGKKVSWADLWVCLFTNSHRPWLYFHLGSIFWVDGPFSHISSALMISVRSIHPLTYTEQLRRKW